MNDLVNLTVCVDDTDDLTKSTSTGAVAECLAQTVVDCGGLLELGVSRHQLILDNAVNYTSHNSAMAFSARIVADTLDEVYCRFVETIDKMKAQTANPGLCMVVVPDNDYAEKENINALVDFGFKAKKQVLTLDDAYCLASSIPWVALTEHGGTGEGAIGALAGAGLRLSGCDGRFRGKWDLAELCSSALETCATEIALPASFGAPGENATLADSLLLGTSAHTAIALSAGHMKEMLHKRIRGAVSFITLEGEVLDPATPVVVTRDAKPLLHGNALTIVTTVQGGVAWPCDKTQLDATAGAFNDMSCSCACFERDNDEEETFSAGENSQTCANCLYRRWTAQGFACMRKAG